MTKQPPGYSPLDKPTRDQLLNLHRSLMRLHKTLLDDERVQYEKQHGPMGSPGRILELVMSDPWFDWLHRISQLIIRIDEITEDKQGSIEKAHEVIEQTASLIRAREGQDEFILRYKAVLRRNPAAVNDHADVLRVVHADRH